MALYDWDDTNGISTKRTTPSLSGNASVRDVKFVQTATKI
jgi:hypothetical protein